MEENSYSQKRGKPGRELNKADDSQEVEEAGTSARQAAVSLKAQNSIPE